MDNTLTRENEPAEAQGISGERRNHRRYSLQLELKWKLIRRRRVLGSGSGSTLDLSSGGVRFDAGHPLAEGLDVELSIAWPVLLHNVAKLQLTVFGRIVRGEGRLVAVQMVQHEFRTTGVPAEGRTAPAGTQSGFALSSPLAMLRGPA